MGRVAKSKGKLKRKMMKAARKAAMKAQYKAYAESGKNDKSVRQKRKGTERKAKLRLHPTGPCGNVGCEKCFGIDFKPYLKDGEAHGMPHRIWLKWEQFSGRKRKNIVESVQRKAAA